MKPDYVFELSWEVCNKVGGIYTVVTSKVLPMLRHYGEGYIAIGPYLRKSDEFDEHEAPKEFREAFGMLAAEGIICHYGTWRINGEPNAILIEYQNYRPNMDAIKSALWEQYQIDSLGTGYHDFDEPILWSTCAGKLIGLLSDHFHHKKLLAHCHEWLSGGALLYLKTYKQQVATVFTTHATMLGRSLSAENMDIYGKINEIDATKEAYRIGIQAKFLTEKACALHADTFTTVSEITGIEATHFLGKKPDVLLPNGLDSQAFPTFDEASVKHKNLKNKLKRFMMFYFMPYYQFDLDQTLVFFLAGRYEYQNKGIDVFIQSLAKLNEQLKNENSEKTVVAFIYVPTATKGIRPEIMEAKTYFEDIDDAVHDLHDEIRQRAVYAFLADKKIDDTFLFGESFVKSTAKKLIRFHREGDPPLCTHHLQADHDAVIEECKRSGLLNRAQDKVKIIFYPIYLTGADQLTDLTYYEAIMASHLGVFPSYYEPWGYTPLEAGALGVASVTTDLAGFGRYVQRHTLPKKNPGIYVLERQNKPHNEIVDHLHSIFSNFCSGNKQDRIENKLRAKRLADIADWNLLVEHYFEAHELAVGKVVK